MWPLLPFAIGSVGSTVAGLLTNSSNAKQARLNREFQERMSNTQYRRAVADMKAAGLNPALAYEQGGASTPTGSTATMQNPAPDLGSTAVQASQAQNAKNLINAQIAATNAQAAKTAAETENQRILNSVAEERAKLEIEGLRFGNTESYERGDRSKLENQFLRDTWPARYEKAQEELRNMQQNTATQKAQEGLAIINKALQEQNLPAAKAAAKLYESWIGKSVPWVMAIIQMLTGAAKIIP